MVNYILNFIFIYSIIGIPFMLNEFENINLSYAQLMFRWFCWPVVILKYIKELWKK